MNTLVVPLLTNALNNLNSALTVILPNQSTYLAKSALSVILNLAKSALCL